MWRNDIKCKICFMYPMKNLARKGLNEHVIPKTKQDRYYQLHCCHSVLTWPVIDSWEQNIRTPRSVWLVKGGFPSQRATPAESILRSWCPDVCLGQWCIVWYGPKAQFEYPKKIKLFSVQQASTFFTLSKMGIQSRLDAVKYLFDTLITL